MKDSLEHICNGWIVCDCASALAMGDSQMLWNLIPLPELLSDVPDPEPHVSEASTESIEVPYIQTI